MREVCGRGTHGGDISRCGALSAERAKVDIVYKNPEELTPYENNTKVHPPEQVDRIAESIKRFGWQQPIVVDRDNVVIIGHGRLLAAKQLFLESVPVVYADNLTEEEAQALRLADNKTNESPWDFGKLEEELAALSIAGIDMSKFGFEVGEDFIDHTEITEDETPEVPEEPKAKRGEIYRLGNHRLMCGDSTSKDDVDALIDGASVDMIYTDPPYGMNLDTDFSSMKNHLDFAKEKGFVGGKKYEQGIVDDFTPEMIEITLSINADEVFLWGADYYAEILPDRNKGSWIVWDKRANGNDDINEDYQSDKMYGSCFELCWSKKRHKRDIARVKWAGVFGTEQEPDKKRFHPTQKPVGLSKWFVDRFSTEGQTILDLFGGSGSTLIACEQTGRKCYMMELDPHYIDVIIQRWENLTGQTAELLKGVD
jgi:site-specific DNA-methyltransferase (adenine-specific)